jgi:hypothetical protein
MSRRGLRLSGDFHMSHYGHKRSRFGVAAAHAAFICTVLLAVFVASPATADERGPWQWTDEERMAARFDPEKIRERREAHEREQRARNPQAHALSPTVNVIDGSRNPELLMPRELFQTLILRALDDKSGARDHIRCRYAKRAPWIAGDPEFWWRLEAAAAPFLRALERSRENGRIERETGIPPAPGEAFEQCQNRMVALNAARETFGRERFDEFLYTAVAPDGVSFADGDDAPTPSRLLWIARGCR